MNVGNKDVELIGEDNVLKHFLVFSASFMTVLVCLQLFLLEPINNYFRAHITNSNVIPYVVFVIIYILSMFLYEYIIGRTNVIPRLNKCSVKTAKWIGISIVLIGALVFCLVYITEVLTFDSPSRSQLQYHMNEPVTIIFVLGLFIVTTYFIECTDVNEIADLLNAKFKIFGFLVSIIYGYSFFTPNCFTTFSNIHHVDAYYVSVFRTMMGMPRTHIDSGIYGFYSFLLAPFVKLFGGNFTSFIIVISILGGVCLFCCIYAIDVIIKNPMIKVFSAIALTLTQISMGWNIYYQIYPHRVIFPCLIIFYSSFLYKNKLSSKLWKYIGYLLASLAIVWNVETGVICLLTWFAYEIFDELTTYKFSELRLYLKVIIEIIWSVCAFLLAILFVEVVNIIMGGELISFHDFLFPLLTTDYMVGDLLIPLPNNVAVWWVLEFGLLLLFLGYGIGKFRSFTEAKYIAARYKLFLVITLLGLGQMIYYINRSAWGNLKITYYMVILLLGVLADWSHYHYKSVNTHSSLLANLYRSFTYLTVTIMITICFGTFSNYYNVESTKTGLRDMSEVTSAIHEIQNSIPKDTRAIGNGLSEIYSYLGWDPYYYTIDLSDVGILPESINYLNSQLSSIKTPLLINAKDLEYLDSHSPDHNGEFYLNNTISKEIIISDVKLYYFIPN